MAVREMNHVGIVVDDLHAAMEFFAELGLDPGGETAVEGSWVDRIVGLEGVSADTAMMRTPDGHGRLELIRFSSPPSDGGNGHVPANVQGLRHVAFIVDDIDDTVTRLQARGGDLVGHVEQYEDMFRLCYLRGPAGVIVELAERLA
jgi:catechol 2,3-dioxygenase-like lactoylglutathione lyase family enzyme